MKVIFFSFISFVFLGFAVHKIGAGTISEPSGISVIVIEKLDKIPTYGVVNNSKLAWQQEQRDIYTSFGPADIAPLLSVVQNSSGPSNGAMAVYVLGLLGDRYPS